MDSMDLPILTASAAGHLVPVTQNKIGEECIVLASALVYEETGPPSFCVSFVIPKRMVISIKELKL